MAGPCSFSRNRCWLSPAVAEVPGPATTCCCPLPRSLLPAALPGYLIHVDAACPPKSAPLSSIAQSTWHLHPPAPTASPRSLDGTPGIRVREEECYTTSIRCQNDRTQYRYHYHCYETHCKHAAAPAAAAAARAGGAGAAAAAAAAAAATAAALLLLLLRARAAVVPLLLLLLLLGVCVSPAAAAAISAAAAAAARARSVSSLRCTRAPSW